MMGHRPEMKKRVLTALKIALLMEGLLILLLSSMKMGMAVAGGDENVSEVTKKSESAYMGGTHSIQRHKEIDQRALKIYKKNRKNLILVNEKHKMKRSDAAFLRTICNGRLQAAEQLYDPLVKLLSDAEKEGYRFWIASAYRSRKKQQKLVDEDVRLEMKKGASHDEALRLTYLETMPPGHSEHETGLALDILCSGNMKMDSSQEREPGNRWLRKNCHRYGFILRYPKNKKKITGISYEPWHLRYVGVEASKYMKERNMTLEEFWEVIQK